MLEGVVVAEAVDGGPDHERAGIAEQQRVAVGLGGRRRLAAERAAGAAAVLDDHGLAEDRPEPLRHQPRGEVDRPAGRVRHHHLDQPVGIALGAGEIGDTERGGERDEQAQHAAASNHGRPPGIVLLPHIIVAIRALG